jgi:hypothetical protein
LLRAFIVKLKIDSFSTVAFNGTQTTPVDFPNCKAMDKNHIQEQPSEESSEEPFNINVNDVETSQHDANDDQKIIHLH